MSGRQELARPRVILMGVAGSGKSTVGELLAADLGVPFVDGDNLHPAANVAKMAGGTPLTDDDRRPWLARVGETAAAAPGGIVIACSALRRVYREQILAVAPDVVFVHLDGPQEILAARLGARPGHFMPPALLASQLATLEPLAAGEPGVVVPITDAPADVARAAAAALAARAAVPAP